MLEEFGAFKWAVAGQEAFPTAFVSDDEFIRRGPTAEEIVRLEVTTRTLTRLLGEREELLAAIAGDNPLKRTYTITVGDRELQVHIEAPHPDLDLHDIEPSDSDAYPDLSRPPTEHELFELDHLLRNLEHREGLADLSEFDGFATAVVSGPDVILPSMWLHAVWGGEKHAPTWKNQEHFEYFFAVMTRHMKVVVDSLHFSPDSFKALFPPTDDGRRSVSGWCRGYMRGARLSRSKWYEDKDVAQLLTPIRFFSSDDNADQIAAMTDEALSERKDLIVPAARAIHAYWLARRSE